MIKNEYMTKQWSLPTNKFYPWIPGIQLAFKCLICKYECAIKTENKKTRKKKCREQKKTLENYNQ